MTELVPPSRSPVLGYNHNVRYRGLVLHVQTEDAGSDAGHVDTHVFRDGAILATVKAAYAAESDENLVRALMKEQHVAVLRDLKGGSFDPKIVAMMGALPPLELGTPGAPSVPGRARRTPATGLVVVRPAVMIGGQPAAVPPPSERSLDDVLRALVEDEER